jgi:hypothetical protein
MGSTSERLASQVQRLRNERAQKFGSGTFLFFEAKGETAAFTPHAERDCGSFTLALDGLPRGIRSRHEPKARAILAGIGLALDTVVGFEKLGDAIVFFAEDTKPIYGFTFEAGLGEVVVSRCPAMDALALARDLAARTAGDDGMERIIRLLNESLEPNQEKLRRFLSAWMALEVFVNKNFAAYVNRFWDSVSAGVTVPIRERYLKRIHDVMGDKYNLLDKFVVISAELNPSEADADIQSFQRGKTLRDEFSHGDAIEENTLPVSAIQGLVRKFLRLLQRD